jgi:hypothetical protein
MAAEIPPYHVRLASHEGTGSHLELEKVAERIAPQVKDMQMAGLIALPDLSGLSPFEQLDAEFSYVDDPETWRTNTILLVGIAAYKIHGLHRHRRAVPADGDILGAPPEAIVKEYFHSMKSDPSLFEQFHLPPLRSHKLLGHHEWFIPERSVKLCQEVKRSADAEFLRHVYAGPETADMLNPKIAYLWGSSAHWQSWRLSDSFIKWLGEFKAHAKLLIVTDLLEQVEAGDIVAFRALQRALLGSERESMTL